LVRSDEVFWEATGYYNDLSCVPPGLLNHRRIWQCLEDLVVGGYIPQTRATEEEPNTEPTSAIVDIEAREIDAPGW
jgi:hypothetical protein